MRLIRRRGRRPSPRRAPRRPRPSYVALRAALVCALLAALLPRAAFAQYSRDRAAREQIERTMAGDYAKRRFDPAEQTLLAVIQACEDECSPATLGRAWMYVGIVQGSGKKDLKAARLSFDSALSEDRAVALDAPLASPDTAAVFEAARQATPERGRTGPLIGAPSAAAGSAEASRSSSARQGLSCTPSEHELQTRRPIPFDCRADAETVRVTLRYREHSGARWQTLELEPEGTSFRATLPCSVTMNSGRLELFVVATDDAGDPVDTLGSKSTPITLVLNPNSSVAPAYPGEKPPERCEEQVLCPPEFPGCEDPDAPGPRGPSAPFREKHRLSLHFAADLGLLSGSDVCTSSNSDYDCFISGTTTPFPATLPEGVAMPPGELGDGYPGTNIDPSVTFGTLRLLLEYDHALSENASIAGRIGYAFRGGPTTLGGNAFLPLHLEALLRYWPSGQWAPGLRPYLHFGGGLAEVDLKKGDLSVRDCTEEPNRAAFLDCIAAQNAYAPENDPDLPVRTLDAYRKLGDAFVSAGGGLLVPLSERVSVQLDLNAMLMFPSVGLVLQPSLGLAYGL